jgi:hypothetical protein
MYHYHQSKGSTSSKVTGGEYLMLGEEARMEIERNSSCLELLQITVGVST